MLSELARQVVDLALQQRQLGLLYKVLEVLCDNDVDSSEDVSAISLSTLCSAADIVFKQAERSGRSSLKCLTR